MNNTETRVLWQSNINEIEYDIQTMFATLPHHRLWLSDPCAQNSYFFPVNVDIAYSNTIDEGAIGAAIQRSDPHIMVHRYRQPVDPLLAACKASKTRLLVWITEQGPEREVEVDRALCFHNVIANNEPDYAYYKEAGVENVYYMPFGCVPAFHRRVEAPARYTTDIVCYGNPLYNYYESKRKAIDTLVKPLVETGIPVALWGAARGNGGWLEVPYIQKRPELYQGVFSYEDLPAVNSGAKIVLGITANAQYGAYGSRLARALSCGAFVIWHYTVGMEKYFENHKHLCWSSSPDETLELVRFYLKNDTARRRIAEEGRRYAHANLDYQKMLLPIIDDVLAQPETRTASAWYEGMLPVRESYLRGNFLAMLEAAPSLMSSSTAPRRLRDEVSFWQANSFFALGHLDKAVAGYSGLLESRQQPEWFNNLGAALVKRGDRTGGERMIERALELRRDYLDARYNLDFLRLNPGGALNLKTTARYIRN
jgi:spore maturation protein CgeB